MVTESLIAPTGATAMTVAIVLRAEQFNVARALSRLTVEVATFDATGSLSSIPPTVPVFFPTIMALDFDLLPEQQAMRFDSSRSPRTAWTSSWLERWQKTSP